MPATQHSKVRVGELAGVPGQDGLHSELQAKQGYSEIISTKPKKHMNTKQKKAFADQAKQNKTTPELSLCLSYGHSCVEDEKILKPRFGHL